MIDSESRSRLLENLAAGLTLPRSLASALGIRQQGRAWLEAGRDLEVLRGADAEFRGACEAAERRAEEARHDRAEQGGVFLNTGQEADRESVASGDLRERGESTSGRDHGDLGAGGSRRETGEEAKEGEGETGDGGRPRVDGVARFPVDADGVTTTTLTMLDVARAGMVANDPCPSFAASTLTGWDRVRDGAMRLGPIDSPTLYRYLLWIESRCIEAGMHALDPAWLRHFLAFYDSGKFIDVGRFGVRAAKSDSTMYALVGEVLLSLRSLQPNIVGVCPIMSSNMREAGDRFDTAKAILRAVGFRDLTGSKATVEPRTFKSSGGGNSALVIELLDSQDHAVEFRVYPASEAGAAGFTGIAGFGDELDLWGKSGGANPAGKVLRVLRSRYTTQPEAKLHLMSATYDRESEHAALIAKGDTPGQCVARLGKEGSALDYAQRMRLATKIQSADPMLVGLPLPADCPDIPCWVTNPITPIEEAYAKSDGNLRDMFALFGGRLEATGGSGMTLEDALYMGAANRALAKPYDPRRMSEDGLFDYTDIPGAESGEPSKYRGL